MKVTENVYYSPEKSGLSIFDSIDTAGSYEFDTFLILQDADGKLFWTTDSGCSCPTPFEHVSEIDEITLDNFESFDTALKNHSGIEDQDYLRISKSVKDHLEKNISNRN